MAVERAAEDSSLRAKLEKHGFAQLTRILGEAAVSEWHTCLAVASGRAGLRRLLGSCPPVDLLCRVGVLKDLATVFLSRAAFPVRCLLFDKTPEANWRVPWHQDLAIPVVEKIECEGFAGWSQKEGVWHVRPPANVLEGMVTLRLHLDECPASNGALRVLPGSHRHGILSTEDIAVWKESTEPVVCAARAGDVLAMRPLLLHASSPSETVCHRRVLHVEYAADDLPGGLRWAEG